MLTRRGGIADAADVGLSSTRQVIVLPQKGGGDTPPWTVFPLSIGVFRTTVSL